MYNLTNLSGNYILSIIKSDKYKNYWAHISENENESLYEHTKLVFDYFQIIIKQHKLGNVIEKLIDNFVSKNYKTEILESSKKFILNLFYNIPIYHDFGKINPNFQFSKMKNKNFNEKNNSLSSDHSKISSFIYIQKHLKDANSNEYCGQEKRINSFLIYLFSHSARKHHSPFIDYSNEYDYLPEFIKDIFEIILEDNFFDSQIQ